MLWEHTRHCHGNMHHNADGTLDKVMGTQDNVIGAHKTMLMGERHYLWMTDNVANTSLRHGETRH